MKKKPKKEKENKSVKTKEEKPVDRVVLNTQFFGSFSPYGW